MHCLQIPTACSFAAALLAVSASMTPLVAQDREPDAPDAIGEAAGLPEGAPEAMAAIDVQGLREHAFHLASDELDGRYTGSAGQFAAARYIADRLAELGFEPLGDPSPDGADGERSFLQSWPVRSTAIDEQSSRLEFGEEAFTRRFAVLPGTQIDEVDVSGQLVDCGYGAPSSMPERFGPGEIPFVLLRTRKPRRQNVNMQFMTGLQQFGKASSIAEKAYARGARAVLFGCLHDSSGLGEMLNYAGLVPGKPLLVYGNDEGMAAMVSRMKQKAPLVFLPRAATVAAMQQFGTVLTEDDKLLATDPPEELHAAVRLRVVRNPEAKAVNVVGVLRGSDPELAKECLVISSHMDHVGRRMDGDVFNGADDNASGSAAMLEVAEAFARGERPKRSVVILSVSGEELGLWGSLYFAENPTWPIENIVANVNIDMIGRVAELSGADEISITPSHAHRRYSSIAQSAAKMAEKVGLGLTIGDEFYTRSDHYNFAERGIPVVFFTDGEHEDYHQVTDTPDKLEYGKIERVARLAFWTALEVANDAGRPREIGRKRDWF